VKRISYRSTGRECSKIPSICSVLIMRVRMIERKVGRKKNRRNLSKPRTTERE
jgi:hypothetical protein